MLRKIIDFISLKILSPIKFDRIVFLLSGKYYNLTSEDRKIIQDLCSKGSYIWITRRKTHLTTYLISFADFGLGFIKYIKGEQKFPKLDFKKYTHALFNLTDDVFVEAIGKGVVDSYFDDCMNVDWACALKPTGLTKEEWDQICIKMIDISFTKLGIKYDTVFNIKDNSELSCVELIRDLLIEALGHYRYMSAFEGLESLINKKGNLTPHMFRESDSFEIVYEVKR